MNIIALLLMLWLGLFSTTGPVDGAEVPEPSATTPPAEAEPFPSGLGPLRTQAEIEQRFLTRYPIAACDLVEAEVGDPVLADPTTYGCLQAAADTGDGAELVIVSTDADGEPATVYLRVNPDGPMEVFADRREGTRGPGWQYQRCPVPEEITGPCLG
jgi:hypothetical protein